MFGDEAWWRFEVRLGTDPRWLPYDSALWLKRAGTKPKFLDGIGPQQLEDFPETTVELVSQDLVDVLPTVAGYGQMIGVRSLRVVAWTQPDQSAAPDIVIPATDEQMAGGRLAHWVHAVERAQQKVEQARANLRAQVLKSAFIDRLGRNAIARVTEGALTRRLVLALLAGRDLVDAVRRDLPAQWPWTCPSQEWALHESDEPEPGPYWCGPVRMRLQDSGAVMVSMVDLEGTEPELLDEGVDEDDIEDYHNVAGVRVRANAEQVLARLESGGFRLSTSSGADAGIDDLAQTYRGGGLRITRASDRNSSPQASPHWTSETT